MSTDQDTSPAKATSKKFTDLHARTAKPKDRDYKLGVEKGLYLLVKANGKKYWRYKYRVLGKEKVLALGIYPEVSLLSALDEMGKARLLVKAGTDPLAAKQEAKKQEVEQHIEETEHTFRAIGLKWFDHHMPGFSATHQERARRMMEKDLFPPLGDMPMRTITKDHVEAAINAIAGRGAKESARRTFQIARMIFKHGQKIIKGLDNPCPDVLVPKAPKPSNFAAITTPKEAGKLMMAIWGYQGTATVMAALKLSPLIFCRPGEVRHLEWKEINWEKQRIEIPGSKMKKGLPHIAPLSSQALTILEGIKPITGHGKYVFPSQRGQSRPMSENTIRTALRSLGYSNGEMTAHGFRAMARTLLDEELGFKSSWIELQLAHKQKGTLGDTYNRSKYLKQRTEMMQKYADYLDKLKLQAESKNVVTVSFKGSARGGR